jgi:glutaminyl-peptide cyclotransferase
MAAYPSRGLLLLLLLLQLVPCLCDEPEWHESPHDSSCYSQGLTFLNSTHLLETCGLYGESRFQIYRYDASERKLERTFTTKPFPQKYFLEGAILFPASQVLYLLTWREKVVFRYRYTNESNSFEWLTPLKWDLQGWGITHNHSHIFISDGSHRLYVTDQDLTVVQTLEVSYEGRPLVYLNELEWRREEGEQFIYANVYFQDAIYKITPSGTVAARVDHGQLRRRELEKGPLKSDEVFNGIAFKDNTMVVTGKKWRRFFIA